MIRVIVVDDHEVVRRGLALIINKVVDMEVVAGVPTGEEALGQLTRGLEVDAMLLDISLPGKDGLEVLKEIKVRWPALPVVMLTMHPERQFALRAFKNGASGYLTKDTSPEELLRSLRTVAEGRRYITPKVAERMAEFLTGSLDGPLHARLSDRELQVLIQIAKGLSLKQIADLLCLSDKTISTYRARVCDKLRVDTNADLVRYAIEHGLV